MVVVVVLGFGLFRGRRNGMAKELLPLFQWLVVVLASGMGYALVAGVLAAFLPDALWACITAYLALALAVFILFALLKRRLAARLVKSDLFKGGE